MFHNLQREILLDHIILVCYTPTHREGAILQSPCPSVRSHFRNRYLSFYWKKLFYIWFALAWWLVPCLPFPGLLHIYFLFTVWLKIFHVCRIENFHNRYLSFYWKKWFYIWYMALAWWLVPCLPFPGLPHIYVLFTVRLRIFHICRNKNFCNRYLSFYWKKWFYTPTHREGAILQSPCPSVHPFTLSLQISQLLLEEMILYLIYGFGMVTCTVSPLSRFTAHLLPVYCVT
jgi:hypothetical protein